MSLAAPSFFFHLMPFSCLKMINNLNRSEVLNEIKDFGLDFFIYNSFTIYLRICVEVLET